MADIVTQLAGNAKSLIVTGAVIAGIGLIPGFPTMMFFLVGGMAALGGYLLKRKNDAAEKGSGHDLSGPLTSDSLTHSEALSVKPNDIFEIVAGKNVLNQIDTKLYESAYRGFSDDAYRKTGVWFRRIWH